MALREAAGERPGAPHNATERTEVTLRDPNLLIFLARDRVAELRGEHKRTEPWRIGPFTRRRSRGRASRSWSSLWSPVRPGRRRRQRS